MKRGVPGSPKFAELAAALGAPRYQAVGVLESLWHFTATQAPRGDIGRWTNRQIAAAIDWRQDADRLIEVLVETRWLDRSAEHRLVVHDWEDHADQTVQRSPLVRKLGFVHGDAEREASVRPAGDASGASEQLASDELQPRAPTPSPVSSPEPSPSPEDGGRRGTTRGTPGDASGAGLPPASDAIWDQLANASPIPGVTTAEARVWGDLMWPAMVARGMKQPRRMLTSWWKRLNGAELANVRRVIANRRSAEMNGAMHEQAAAAHDDDGPVLELPVRRVGGGA